MAYVTSPGQVADMVKCSRPSQADVILVTMDALVEKVCIEHFIANRNVTVKSDPCVLDLAVCFSESVFFLASFLASKFATDRPR